jgi:hypothetical protein
MNPNPNPNPRILTDDILIHILQFAGSIETPKDYRLFKLGFDERKTRKTIKKYIIRKMHTCSDTAFIQAIHLFDTIAPFSKRLNKRIGYFMTTIQYLTNSHYYDVFQRDNYIHADIDWERNIYITRSMTILQCLICEPWQNFTKPVFEKLHSIPFL